MADASPATAWRWGHYLLQPSQRRLLRDGVPVELEDRAFDLIVFLLLHRERSIDRQEIISEIWGKRPVSDATLRQLVYKARRAIGDDGDQQLVIHTLYGRSLQWVAPVEVVFESGPRISEDEQTAADVDIASEMAQAVSAAGAITMGIPARAIRATRPTAFRRGISAAVVILVLVLVLVLAVAGIVTWVALRPHRGMVPPSAAAQPVAHPATLAVLPFVDLDPRQDQRYLSDGLTEELINRLAQMPHLRVTAPTSSFMFRKRPLDVQEVARRLGVANVLEGSVQRAGDRWRVRVALVDARSNFELWAGEYDSDSGDLLAMEDRIAGNVVTALYPKLDAGLPGKTASHSRVNAAAHDAYLVGLEYLGRRTPADLEQAVAYFQRAVAASPNYADAWAALAMTYGVMSDYKEIPPDTYYPDARAAAERALALDPNLARGHAVLGWLHEIHWQWAPARAEFERALQLDPNDATARQWYAMYLWYMRDMGAALEQMRFAHQLDPLSPVINVSLGRALLYAGHVDEAITQFRATISAQPDFAVAHLLLGETLLALKRNQEALREVRVANRLSTQPPPSTYVAALGVALKANGDLAGARATYAALQARSKQQFVSGVSLAWLRAELGDGDGAVSDLARALAQHDPMMQPAVTDSSTWWYSDPRIAKLRVRMGLPAR